MKQFLEFTKMYIMGLRKWSFAILMLGVTTSLVVAEYINGSNYALIWSSIGSAFMASNMIEHIFKKGQANGTKSR